MSANEEQRIDAIDALRGLALGGIVVAHMYEQFISAPRPPSLWLVEPTLVDQIISLCINLLVYSKFYTIFSILFGVSFAIMMDKAAQRGESFGGRFLWRLVLLGVIGFFHALLYRGDILTVYVSIGILLPLLYRLPDKWLLLLCLPIFLGVGRYLFFGITGAATLLPELPMPDAGSVARYVELLRHGSFIEVVRENFVTGFAHKFDFQVAAIGRQYLTLAYFLVGLWLYRSGFLRRLTDSAVTSLKKIFWWSLGATILLHGATLLVFMNLPQPFQMASWNFMFSMTVYDLASLAATVTIASGFLWWYLSRRDNRPNGLCSYGRTALSNYVLQTLIGTFIFFGWGLGLVGKLHDWQTFLLSAMIIIVQIRLSQWWLARFKYGPLEWLWRSATYLRWARFRRELQAC